MGEAKAVLIDPETRNFYDMYGEDGVAFQKAWKEAKPNETLQQMGAGGIACFCCTNCCCVMFIMLFPVLVCLKVLRPPTVPHSLRRCPEHQQC